MPSRMAPSKWTALTVLLGLPMCWSVGCAPEPPADPTDYDVVSSHKKSDAKDGQEEQGSDPAPSGDSDRAPPAATTTESASDGGSSNTGATLPKNTLLLDGKPMTISAAEAHVNAYGGFYTVDFTGENAPAKTQIILNFQNTGTGCSSGAKAKELYLYPGGSSSNAYVSKDSPTCGLEITAFPAKVGDVAAGTFDGTLDGLNGVSGKTRTLKMSFELKSIPQP